MTAPTPYQLGLSADPDRTWEQMGIAVPTPADLFGAAPDLTWKSPEEGS